MKGHTISWGECTYPERVTGRYVLEAEVWVMIGETSADRLKSQLRADTR